MKCKHHCVVLLNIMRNVCDNCHHLSLTNMTILYIKSLVACVRASVCLWPSVCDRQSVTVNRESQISRSWNSGPKSQVLRAKCSNTTATEEESRGS
jgi:hypothetical protein